MMSQMLLSAQAPQLLLVNAPVNHRFHHLCRLTSPPPPAWLMTRGRRIRKGPRRTPATSASPMRSWCWSSSATTLCCGMLRWQITGGRTRRTRSGKTRPSWWRRQPTPSRAGSSHCVTPTHALTRRRAAMVPQTWLRGRSGSSPSSSSWRRSLATVLSPSRV